MLEAAIKIMYKNKALLKGLIILTSFTVIFHSSAASAEIFFGEIESNQNEVHLALPVSNIVKNTFKRKNMSVENADFWEKKWDAIPRLIIFSGLAGVLFSKTYYPNSENNKSETMIDVSRVFSFTLGSLGRLRDPNFQLGISQFRDLLATSMAGSVVFSHAANYYGDAPYSLSENLILPAVISGTTFCAIHYGVPFIKKIGLSAEQSVRNFYDETKDQLFNGSSIAEELKENARLTCQGNGYQNVDSTKIPLGKGFLRHIVKNKILKKRMIHPLAFKEGDIYFLGRRLKTPQEYSFKLENNSLEYYTWAELPCKGNLDEVKLAQSRKDGESLQEMDSKKHSIHSTYTKVVQSLKSLNNQDTAKISSLFDRIDGTIHSSNDGRIHQKIAPLLVKEDPILRRQIFFELYSMERFDIVRNLLLEMMNAEYNPPLRTLYDAVSKVFLLNCPICLNDSGTSRANDEDLPADHVMDDIVVSNCGHSICKRCIQVAERNRCEFCNASIWEIEPVLVPLEELL